MSIQKTEAIVLRRTEFRETSLIATFYTPAFGKIKGIVKGIRSRENKHEGTLDLGSVNWIVFYEKPRSELYLVSQVELKQVWHGLSRRLEQVLFLHLILEEMELLTPLHEPAPELYDLLYKTLEALSEVGANGRSPLPKPEVITRHFEIQMMNHFGVRPQLDHCLVCRGTIEGNSWMSFSKGGLFCRECHEQEIFAEPVSFEAVAVLRQLGEIHVGAHCTRPEQRRRDVPLPEFSPKTYRELENILRGLIEHHVEKPLRSAKVIEEMIAM